MVIETSECNKNSIQSDLTIIEAMRVLDELSIKVLFVVDEAGKVVASLTDGDIRRAILSGKSLDSTIYSISNHNCIVVKKSFDLESVKALLTTKGITAIPVVDDNGKIQKILYNRLVKRKSINKDMNISVVIMAGGKGTRLYPYTKILPKPLIPIEDTPIAERIINSFMEFGCDKFYMVVNYKKNMIKSYFADAKLDCDLEFVDEDVPLGTGGGLKLLEKKVNSTFILSNCDILVLEDVKTIVDHHAMNNNDVTMVCSLKNFEIPYGTVEFSDGGTIESFNEKPKLSFFTNTGYYVVEPCIMEYIGEGESIGMPDIIDRMRKDGRRVGGYPISDNVWLDMGQFDSMENMERRLRQFGEGFNSWS